MSKIFLIGGNRGLGKSILLESINHDYKIISMSRTNKNNNQARNITYVKGDAKSKIDIEKNIENSSVVINSINVMRKNIFPWAKITNSKTTISESAKNLVEVCNEKKISRIIVISAWGTNETRQELKFGFRSLIKYSNLRYPYKDHEKQEKIIQNSGLNWTIIRPVALTNFGFTEKVKIYNKSHPKFRLIISRKSLARFIFKIINDKNFFKRSIVVSN